MSEAQILRQISTAADTYDDWKQLELFTDDSPEAGLHIACMVEPFLGYILEGKKTIESRFSKPLIPPYQRVTVGDVVLLKSGPIVASFRTTSVDFIELNGREFNRLIKDYSAALCADEEFWEVRADKRYASLLGISDVRQLTPLRVNKRDRRGWMVLREPPNKANPSAVQFSSIEVDQRTRNIQPSLDFPEAETCADGNLFA